MEIKSLSDKRFIIPAFINDKPYNFLLDTGATVGLVSKRIKGLNKGAKFPTPLVGAGGEFTAYYCRNFVRIGDKDVA